MKKVVTLLVLALFLVSYASAYSTKITPKAIDNPEDGEQGNQISTQNEGEATQVQARVLTQTQIQEIKKETKRIRIQEGECPEECDCTGSAMKCALEKGGREMTVTAGSSGNTIIQVKGVNGSTKATLYKSDGKIYGEFNGETKEVRVMPDMVKDKVRERVEKELEDEEIELGEDGVYQYKAKKKVKLFGFIRTRTRVRAKINAETGELERIRNSWWAFLASDDAEPIVGAGCGIVSPDNRSECCMNKGFDSYNTETNECILTE